jgi:bifunctional non-homologous end joining protein LigD
VKSKAAFIAPMLLEPSATLPEGPQWSYELKLDGYRMLAIRHGGEVSLRSRNDNDFTARYPAVAQALGVLPDDTVLDGEIVALDAAGRPSFNTLQNAASGEARIFYYGFDLLVLGGRDLTGEPLAVRRDWLERKVLPKLEDPIRHSMPLEGTLSDILRAVRAHGFEGVVAKRLDSRYERGQRSGAWRKMRLHQGQEFVIGGYTPGGQSFDALVLGVYEGRRLLYVARTRNGFTPRSRLDLFPRLRALESARCPFANLPEAKGGRWGQGLTAEKMAECRWLQPRLVAQVEFVEWTPDHHLRHSRFVGLRDDKDPRSVRREIYPRRSSEM